MIITGRILLNHPDGDCTEFLDLTLPTTQVMSQVEGVGELLREAERVAGWTECRTCLSTDWRAVKYAVTKGHGPEAKLLASGTVMHGVL